MEERLKSTRNPIQELQPRRGKPWRLGRKNEKIRASVGSVAADPDNIENRKEAGGGGHKVLRA